MKSIPDWMTELETDELNFIKKFILASGSLKEMAEIYKVTYPTVRVRLNNIIEKIKMAEEKKEDPYVKLIKKLALEEKIDFDAATMLIQEYREKKGEV